nr:ribosomal protein L5 [Cyanidioschyzonaceae sp. 1 FvB-2021]
MQYLNRLQYYNNIVISYQLILKLNQSNKLQLPNIQKCVICFKININTYKSVYLNILMFRELQTGTRILIQFISINKSFKKNPSMLLKATLRNGFIYNWLDFINIDNKIRIEKTFYTPNSFSYLLFMNKNNVLNKDLDNLVKIILFFSLKNISWNRLLISYYNPNL